MADGLTLFADGAEEPPGEPGSSAAAASPFSTDPPDWPIREFITGPAGTGKTTLVRARALRTAGVELCATTGIAAVNLGPDVTTINSLLAYFDTAGLRDAWTTGRLSVRLAKLANSGCRAIVLDEVSMLDGEQLRILELALREVNQRRAEQSVPPLHLTLTGDFAQLPPVKAKFAFEVPEWDAYEENTLRLHTVYRQADPDFLAALFAARRGDGATAATILSPRCVGGLDYHFDGTTILARNEDVDRFNALRLSQLQTQEITFTSVRWGKERAEWKVIAERLLLKLGALVMILANRHEDKSNGTVAGGRRLIYANGDLGYLREVDANGVPYVELTRTGEVVPVGFVTRDNKIPLEPGRRKELKAAGLGELAVDDHEIIGSLTYMPLRVAYATSCHKSQGLSLDKVQVDLRQAFFNSGGMAYVALSRARTADGLRIVASPALLAGRCRVNEKVRRWI